MSDTLESLRAERDALAVALAEFQKQAKLACDEISMESWRKYKQGPEGRADPNLAGISDGADACIDAIAKLPTPDLARARKIVEDAERYQWIRSNDWPEYLCVAMYEAQEDEMDEAIDKARGK